jgi:hypothetical protein
LLPLQKAPTAKVFDPNPEASGLFGHGATMILKNLQLVSPKKMPTIKQVGILKHIL